MKKETKNFPLCPKNEISPHDKLSDYMIEMKSNTYTQKKKK